MAQQHGTFRQANDIPVIVLDRSKLRWEERFANSAADADLFYLKERILRADAAQKQIPSHLVQVRGIADLVSMVSKAYPSGVCEPIVGVPWSEETLQLGRHIFGPHFDSYPRGDACVSAAVICPASPFFDMANEIDRLGLIAPRPVSRDYLDLALRHEKGHLRFYYLPGQDFQKEYFSEALADGYALVTHLEEGDAPEAVNEFIHLRRLEAFLGASHARYWTAAACEATLEKNKIPLADEAFFTIRGLHLRIYEKLLSESTGVGSKATFSNDEKRNVKKYKGSLDREVVREHFGFSPPVRFAASAQIQALAPILETEDLAPQTRREGEKVIEAFNYFCPNETITLAPVQAPAPPSKSPSLLQNLRSALKLH
jgi:hypothetical protein